ncbi:suppressor of deletion of TFIIS [Coemansia nantahalensis]|uniref:Suppressor of deletion of TFIIS n=1 Tax=Coemansia nantahalensis TaxID=2789366 RepID=A0ACC1K8R6_9FUNG|nr:suppressor of deletion of TFIIS [Coemansia nantahalensis]
MTAGGSMDGAQDERVLFLDIDNCLYPPDLGIDKMMKERIYAFGRENGLDAESVEATCSTYYRDYGLSVRGFIRHHGIDPAAFNEKVDESLPLEAVIATDPALRAMLESVRVRRWAFTNASLQHARRVLRCLGVDDLFEGITSCDYCEPDFPCKPERRAYDKAVREARAGAPQQCYFADDSIKNVAAARDLGWTAVLVSPAVEQVCAAAGSEQVRTVHQLPLVLPQLFA